MNLLKTMSNMLITNREMKRTTTPASIGDINAQYEAMNQYELGTLNSPDNAPRTRQDIYSTWELMQKDPQIAEALSLHVTAALGGHETTGDMIFITPHERVRGKGKRARELRDRVEREALHLAPIINQYAFTLARQAIAYGDSYARIYTDKRLGVVGLMNNRHTAPSLIMPFEQAGQTVGFHGLEEEDYERSIAKLTPMQLLRVKMQRIEVIPQMPMQVWQDQKTLIYDQRCDNPVMPAEIGGSFLYPVEKPWKDTIISLAGLNNQQIADSVKQAFLTVNMEGMPPKQQTKYRKSITDMLTTYRDQIQEAFKGGEALHGTKYHVLPQWGDKQILQSVGDLSQRNMPLSPELLMLNLRRVAGGLGIDLSLVGWADMLAGGIGDGASFQTSAQIMRRSNLIRTALIESFNHLMSIHWGIKYGESFDTKEYPWQYDFFSDAGAATAQALSNKQNRANTLTIEAQAIQMIKELALGKETTQLILEDRLDYDLAFAEKMAIAITAPPMGEGLPAGMPQPPTDDSEGNNLDNDLDDDLPDELEEDDYED